MGVLALRLRGDDALLRRVRAAGLLARVDAAGRRGADLLEMERASRRHVRVVLTFNLLADLAYDIADPRIRYD
jgi:hypothetical protein